MGRGLRNSLAPNPSSSMTNNDAMGLAPALRHKSTQADTVPPVASRSSMITMFWPSSRASICISNVFEPYSRSYSTENVSYGNFPGLRIGTKLIPSLAANNGPKMKPRASGPTTASGRQPRPSISSAKRSMISDMRPGSLSTGVMSRNMIPSIGKSGTVRIASLRLRSNSSDMLNAPRKGGSLPRRARESRYVFSQVSIKL